MITILSDLEANQSIHNAGSSADDIQFNVHCAIAEMINISNATHIYYNADNSVLITFTGGG
jgi:hypothetical protein